MHTCTHPRTCTRGAHALCVSGAARDSLSAAAAAAAAAVSGLCDLITFTRQKLLSTCRYRLRPTKLRFNVNTQYK